MAKSPLLVLLVIPDQVLQKLPFKHALRFQAVYEADIHGPDMFQTQKDAFGPVPERFLDAGGIADKLNATSEAWLARQEQDGKEDGEAKDPETDRADN